MPDFASKILTVGCGFWSDIYAVCTIAIPEKGAPLTRYFPAIDLLPCFSNCDLGSKKAFKAFIVWPAKRFYETQKIDFRLLE